MSCSAGLTQDEAIKKGESKTESPDFKICNHKEHIEL